MNAQTTIAAPSTQFDRGTEPIGRLSAGWVIPIDVATADRLHTGVMSLSFP